MQGKVSRSPSRYMLRRCQPARHRYCSPGSMVAAFRTCILGILVFSGCSQGLQLPFGLSSWLQTGWQHHHHHCKPYHVRSSHVTGSLVVHSRIANRSRRPIPPISTQYCDRRGRFIAPFCCMKTRGSHGATTQHLCRPEHFGIWHATLGCLLPSALVHPQKSLLALTVTPLSPM